MKPTVRRILKVLLILLLVLLLIVGAYVAYVFLSWKRVPDGQPLDVQKGAQGQLAAGQELTAITWNLGFGAYSDDFTFFMDGDTQSWAWSKEAVLENIAAAIGRLEVESPDIMLLQEVDWDSTRSYHVDERDLICETFPDMDSVYAVNYDSPFLFYPLTRPHGASRSGILTLAGSGIDSALRRSLPIEKGLMRVVDLDRCYSVARLPVDNGRELCLVNLHLSAYSSDGSIATEQLKMLIADIQDELDAGNYVIAGAISTRICWGIRRGYSACPAKTTPGRSPSTRA